MKATIVTLGSRGDVQPLVALGLGLQGAGHSVRVATHSEFEPFVRSHGLDFRPIEGNPQKVLASEAGLAWLDSGRNPIAYLRRAMRIVQPLLSSILADCEAACRGSDLIIDSEPLMAGVQMAERLDVPGFFAPLVPLAPSRAIAHPLVTLPRWARRFGAANWTSHAVISLALWLAIGGATNRWRVESLGLPRIRSSGLTWYLLGRGFQSICGFSKHVIPHAADWPGSVHITGYWFLDLARTWEPPAELQRFLDDGEPPVCIGFGSAVVRNPERVAEAVAEALRRTGQRALVLRGWSDLSAGQLPSNAYCTTAVPHDWLFPRVAAVVHHGGAGTTAAGLRAGVPSIVTPMYGDQPLWGRRVAALKVGPEPIPFGELNAERLTEAIECALTDSQLRDRAALLGGRIRAEHGVANAVATITTGLAA